MGVPPAEQGSPTGIDLVRRNARSLTERYLELKKRSVFKRTLEECVQYEAMKTGELYDLYAPHLQVPEVKVLSASYFRDHTSFIRFQEVPDKYLRPLPRNYYFISHRWKSPEHPDPDGAQFRVIRDYVGNLRQETLDSWGFWCDYACIPQRDASGQRNAEEEKHFQTALKVMHLLPMLSASMTLFDEGYLDRSWCFMEWACATRISPIVGSDGFVPLFNRVKFSHLAILVLFLMEDDEFRAKLLAADKQTIMIAVAYLNSLIQRSLATSASTIEDDKRLVAMMMYEHFWNHSRYVGFKTRLLTGMLLLEQLDDELIESLFAQFLIISNDPAMEWTREVSLVLEGLVSGMGTPTDMVFHRHDIDTIYPPRWDSKD